MVDGDTNECGFLWSWPGVCSKTNLAALSSVSVGTNGRISQCKTHHYSFPTKLQWTKLEMNLDNKTLEFTLLIAAILRAP